MTRAAAAGPPPLKDRIFCEPLPVKAFLYLTANNEKTLRQVYARSRRQGCLITDVRHRKLPTKSARQNPGNACSFLTSSCWLPVRAERTTQPRDLPEHGNHNMALLYGLLCSWAVVLRNFAARKHSRLKKIYDQADSAFRETEQECKNHEVAVGRPADYHSQMKLLRQFDDKEQARTRWIAAQRVLQRRSRRSRKLRKLKGKRLPYTFGLLDMALVLKLLDAARELGKFDISTIVELFKSWM